MLNEFLSADIAKLIQLENTLNEAKKAVSKHKKEMTRHCEVKVGDEVTCNGYGHTGKTIVVDKVWLHCNHYGRYEFRASGRIKRKDGTLGVLVGEWYQSEKGKR